MNVKVIHVFGGNLTVDELTLAAEAAARSFDECRKFSLPIRDAMYGQGFEILMVDNAAHSLDDVPN